MSKCLNLAIMSAALIAVLLGFSVSAWANFNPVFARDHMNIFPFQQVAPQLVIDGQLGEWNSDAFVTLYPDPDLLDTFALRIAFAYDEQGLLLAGRFTDLSPLINHNDPTVDPFRGWDGDALQFRAISTAKFSKPFPAAELNSDHIAHMTLWQFSDRNEAVFDVRYGMDFHGAQTLMGKDSGFHFAKGKNSWTLEGRIPWKLLGATAMPQPGESWFMTLQALFGNAEGTLQHNFFECISSPGFHYQRPDGWGQGYFVKANEVAERIAQQKAFSAKRLAREMSDDPDAHSIAVRYTNPQAGFVSLAICNAQGQIIRTLLTKAKRDAGEQSESWNGLDDNGKPAPAGSYQLKALTHPGITGRHVASVHNSGQPAWVNADGTGGWGSDHAPPIDVISGPQGESYLMWTHNEGGSFLLRVDHTGRKQWGANISWGDFLGGATTLAYDTDANGKGVIYVAKDGMDNKQDKGYGGLFVFSAETGRRINFANGQGILPLTNWPTTLATTREAAGPSWERMPAGRYSPEDIAANLQGLAATPNRLFVSYYYENKIVALDKTTFAVQESYPVPRPSQLAYDAAHARLYVVTAGQVAYLDLAHGGTLTPFISTGIEYPFGLALDKDGNLFVSVRGRQMQVRVYSTAGKFLRAIGKNGGRPWEGKFNGKGMLMPSGISVDTHGQLWVMEMDNTPKRQSLWNAKSGKLIKDFYGSAAYAPMMAPDPQKPEEVYIHNTRFIVNYRKGTVKPDATIYRAGLHGPSLVGAELVYGFMGATFQIQRIGNKAYAFDGHGGVYSVAKDRFIPLMYIGQGQTGMPGLPANKAPNHTAVVWKDLNGNGLFDEGEVTISPVGGLSNNISQFGATFFPGAAMIKGGRVFRPNGIDELGMPDYPAPEQAKPVITGAGPMTAYSNWLDVWPSYSSNWQEFYAIASLPRGGALDGAGMDGIYRFDREGNIRWRYSHTVIFFGLKAPLAKDGDLNGALRILGEVELPKENGGEIVGIGVYRGYYSFLTEDGLYVDSFGHENGRGPLPDFDTFFIENFSGYFFQHPKTGKVYLFGGTQEGRIIEMSGWEDIRRFNPDAVTVTADDVVAVEAWLANRGAKDALTAITIAPATPTIDGEIEDWKTPSTLDLGERQSAKVGLAYDATNLYALFSVPDDSPWQNAAKDWRFIFKGGDYLDIQLGVPNPNKDAPRSAQQGDVRVIIAPGDNGAFTVVGMWSKVPAGMEKEPMIYQSPVAREDFERVILLEDVIVKLKPNATGYTVEAAIPWATLGMTAPTPGTTLQGDMGVIFSDKAGMQAIRRVYLFNKDTGVVNDIPSEVRVVSPNWGTLLIE